MIVDKLMVLCTIGTLFFSGFLLLVKSLADGHRAAKEKKYGYCTVSDYSIVWNRLAMLFAIDCGVIMTYWVCAIAKTIQ